MTTGATGQLGLALPVQGELSGTWGDTVNNGITQYTNIAIAGTLTLTGDGAVTLANTTGDASASNITSTLAGAGTVTAQFAIVRVSGTTTTKVVTGPSYSKTYVVDNASSFAVTFKASGQTGVSIAAAEKVTVVFNGTDYIKLAGTIANAAGSNTQIQFNNGGLFGASANLTWDGTTLSSTQVNITGQGTLRLQDTTGGEYVGLRSPSALGASYTLTFPADDGTSGQALITDGSGVLSWSTAASGDVYGPASSTDNAVARFDSTTGKLLQNSVVLIGDTGAVTGVTDLTASGSVTLSGGTANGVAYLNGSKVVTSGSALTFNGTTLELSGSTASTVQQIFGRGVTDSAFTVRYTNGVSGSSAFIGSLGLDYASGTFADMATIKFYRNSLAGELAFFASASAASGSEQMRLTSTGLGIGTSSPAFKLDVNGGAQVVSGSVGGLLNFNYGASTSSRQWRLYNDVLANGDFAISQSTTKTGTTFDAKLYFNASGDVGIGTSSPSSKLQLTGASQAATSLTMFYSAIQAGSIGINSSGSMVFGLDGSTGTTTRLNLDTSGNLGIGTSSPGTKLDVTGAIRSIVSGGTPIFYLNNGTTQHSIQNNSGSLAFYNDGTRGMDLTSTGLGIGTSSPAVKLESAGSSNGATLELLRINNTGSGANTAGQIVFRAAGTNYADIIGGYGASSARLSFNVAAGGYQSWAVAGSDKLTLDSSGNLGLGVTPSAWSILRGFQIGQASALAGHTTVPITYLGANWYFDGTTNKYITTNYASRFITDGNSGGFSWQVAPSGTAGNAITFTQAATLFSTGNYAVGYTADNGYRITAGRNAGTNQLAVTTSGSNGSNASPLYMDIDFLGYADSPRARIRSQDASANTGDGILTFWTNGSSFAERARIDSSGNFLLGNPANNGVIGLRSAGTLYIGGGNSNTNEIILQTGSSERARIDSSGNLLVGTTSSAGKLTVVGGTTSLSLNGAGTQTVLKLNNDDTTIGTNAVKLGFTSSGVVKASINVAVYNNDYMAFNVGSDTERMRIDSSGNLLVGQTGLQASEKFGVTTTGAKQAVSFKNDDNTKDNIVSWVATTSGNAQFIGFYTDTLVQRGSITYNRAGGLVVYNTTSDYRAKDITGAVTDSGSVIDSVPVYMGKMHGATQERPMFIAHETPDYAHTGEKDAVDADGNPVYQQMDASALIPVMWAEIQSLRKRLADAGI